MTKHKLSRSKSIGMVLRPDNDLRSPRAKLAATSVAINFSYL